MMTITLTISIAATALMAVSFNGSGAFFDPPGLFLAILFMAAQTCIHGNPEEFLRDMKLAFSEDRVTGMAVLARASAQLDYMFEAAFNTGAAGLVVGSAAMVSQDPSAWSHATRSAVTAAFYLLCIASCLIQPARIRIGRRLEEMTAQFCRAK